MRRYERGVPSWRCMTLNASEAVVKNMNIIINERFTSKYGASYKIHSNRKVMVPQNILA